MMITYKKFVMVLLGLALFAGCSKDDGPELITPVEEQVLIPELSSISPENGPKNTTVTITGANFGNDSAKIAVYFNGMEANVSAVNDIEIKAEVPALALTGTVKVIVDGRELTGPQFNYEFSEAHVTTLAGNTAEGGYMDGQGADALFIAFGGIIQDMEGNILACQPSNHTIRKITREGLVSTFAGPAEGYEDGPLASAKFSWIKDIAIDLSGNMYIADTNNNRIRKITPDGIVSTHAGSFQGYQDGEGAEAQFFLPGVLTVDANGNVYVAEGSADGNHTRIRKITQEGIVTTFAGGENGYADGPLTEARFKYISALEMDREGNIIVSDRGNFKIRKISPSGQVTTIAGSTEGHLDGIAEEAQFGQPWGLAVDKLNNIYVADYSKMRIRKIDPDGVVSTIAGNRNHGFTDGEGVNARLTFPRTLVVDDNFNIYFTQNNVVRKIRQE